MRKILCLVPLLLCLFSFIAARSTNYEPGTVVFKLKPDIPRNSPDLADLNNRVQAFGMRSLTPRFQTSAKALSDILKLDFDPSYDALGVANALKGHPAIAYIEPIYYDMVFAPPDDSYYASSLNFAALNAEAAWDIYKCEDSASPPIIAIVDTGVPWKHPDLAANIWNNAGEDANSNGYTMYHNGSTWMMDPGDLNSIDDDGNGMIDDLIGWNFMADAVGSQNNDPTDPGNHGTVVSGLAAAVTNNATGAASLSWNPTLMPISCAYPGATSTIYRGYDAIIYAAENGADIINCSWGGSNFSAAALDAIAYARSLGSIIVAAAGNSNNAIPIYPAAYPGVVAIASLMNNGVKWSGSNYGGYVDAGAPNESVYSTSGSSSYTRITGTTSYASPIGAAMLALIRAQNPGFSSEQIINQMKATTDDINIQNPSYQNLLGGGKINAQRALSEVAPSQSPKLHLALFNVGAPRDANLNHAVEPGESFSLDLSIRNYSDFSAALQLQLSSSSPHIVITQNSELGMLPADEYLELEDAFEVQVLASAPSGYIDFQLNFLSATPILSGSSASFKILIHNGGSFVWEAKSGARNQSGIFIRDSLLSLGKGVVYGNTFPASFFSFDSVFLSFGAVDANIGRFSDPVMFFAIKDYLESGGKIYIEGADALGYDLATYFPLIDGLNDGHEILWPLLGIASATDGGTNPISQLLGQPGPTQGLLFNTSNQTNNDYIDIFSPLPGIATAAFIEDDYGTVGIASLGGYDQRCILFSYALAELNDAKSGSDRLDFLQAVLDFYESSEPTLPVTLSSFQALWQNMAVLIWQTASESDLAGFNIYRGSQENWDAATIINPVIIPALGNSSQGSSYRFQDELTVPDTDYYYFLEALYYNGSSELLGYRKLHAPAPEEEPIPQIPPMNALHPAFPNPFSSQLLIPYSLKDAAEVKLTIYDIKGRKVKSFASVYATPGNHHQLWHICEDQLPSGVYLIRMQAGDFAQTMRTLLLK